jgi:hypothetical protein
MCYGGLVNTTKSPLSPHTQYETGESDQYDLRNDRVMTQDAEVENFDEIKTLLPSLPDHRHHNRSTDFKYEQMTVFSAPSAILAIYSEHMSRPEIRNYLQNNGCKIDPTCDIRTHHRRTKYFAMDTQTTYQQTIELIRNDLMVQDPSTKAVVYMAVPLCLTSHIPEQKLIAHPFASKTRQQKINPTQAVFVNNKQPRRRLPILRISIWPSAPMCTRVDPQCHN